MKGRKPITGERRRRARRLQAPSNNRRAGGTVGRWAPLLIPLIYLASAAVAAEQQTARAVLAVAYEDIASQSGVRFQHINGATPQRHMPETMSAGGLFFDYDNDGWIDIFFADGGSFVDESLARRARGALYRNKGDGSFTDVTAHAGIDNGAAYGMGACAADYDNDGWIDLYLTNVGPNVLYRNNGDGTFADVTEEAGVNSPLFSSSCAFGDIDRDGRVDLFVGNFIDFAPDNNKFCGGFDDKREYCHPNVYEGVPNVLYRNGGDGTFTDVTEAANLYTTKGKTLGVVFGDYDNDGWPDIYVANDSVPNFLYRNRGDGTFEEGGLLAGTAVNGDGSPEAGMGTDFGDFDGDGLLDVFVTNLDGQTNTLYRNLGGGMFEDATFETGHGTPSLRYVGWGTAFFDYDNDGDLDMIIANGAVVERPRNGLPRGQRNLLFRNDGNATFEEVGLRSGEGFMLERVSRGLAVGDVDNDGDLDVLVINNGQKANLLRNDGGNTGHALLVRVVGTKSNRDGIGTRLTLTVGSSTQLAEVKAGSSYLGQNDLRVHFGLGGAERADRLELRWPSGTVDVLEDIEANQILTVLEGEGIVRREPLQTAKFQ